MTRQEEISKAARDYAERQTAGLLGIEKQIAVSSYEAGAKWALANQWYEIDEELPPIDEDCLFIFFNGRKNVVGMGYMREDKSVRLEGEFFANS